MLKPSILKAEKQFAKITKQENKADEEVDTARQERAQKIARLKALRLPKENSGQ